MHRFLALLVVPVAAAGVVAAHRAPAATCDPGNAGLTLPKGYCATLFASVTGVRNIAVAANGDVFAGMQRRPGVTALRDRDHDGHADSTVTFGDSFGAGTGIALGSDAIYFSPKDKVVRFAWHPGSLTPADGGSAIVTGLPMGGNHPSKTMALGKDGSLFVDHGSATNSCQGRDRTAHVPGVNPCTERDIRGGIWRYDSRKTGQTPATAEHWGFGMRNAEAIAINPATGELWAAIHGRDQLGDNWGFSDQDNAEKPAEEFGPVPKGADYGWPYCYFDPITHRKVQAPEYGGDGIKPGDCGSKAQPAIGFPGHWAPMMLAFVPNANFGAEYSGGAFLAFHGSWNRAPLPQAGFRVVFIPFKSGKAVGSYTTFAEGAGSQLRISAVAMAPDGSALYIGSDGAGKIWRVVPTNAR
ncbi:MAG TPA: PQQ-dependent sugar dehydrogenase [Gemmatimonadales bacterium]|jgi:glucose/arabinose dehydrogenase